MPQADKALLFVINRTTNRFYGAALADELGDQLVQAKPQFFFPPDWVLEKAQGPAGVAEFAVRYCDDPDTLATIARRERRLGVMKALAGNDYLRDGEYAAMLARIRDDAHRREIGYYRRNEVAEVEEVEAADPIMTLDEVKDLVARGECDPNPLDLLFAAEAERNVHGTIARYLAATYINERDPEFWATTTYSPITALALHSQQEQAAILHDLLSGLDNCSVQRAPLGLDMAEALLASGLTIGTSNTREPRLLFSEEAADVLLEAPNWVPFLKHQLLSEAQFDRMLEVCYTANLKRAFFGHLHGSRERLVKFLAAISREVNSQYWLGGDWKSALECINDPDDPLIFEMVQRSSEYEIRYYVEGSCTVGPDKQITVPTLEQLLALYEQSPESFNYLDNMLIQRSYSYNENTNSPLSEAYIDMLIDNVPGLAYSLLTTQKYGDKLYARLTELGVDEEQMVEVLSDAEELSLKSVIDTLTGAAV